MVFGKQKSLSEERLCDRDRIRTCDRLLRRQMLYPAELRDQLYFNTASLILQSCSEAACADLDESKGLWVFIGKLRDLVIFQKLHELLHA